MYLRHTSHTGKLLAQTLLQVPIITVIEADYVNLDISFDFSHFIKILSSILVITGLQIIESNI